MMASLQARLLLLGDPDPILMLITSIFAAVWEFTSRMGRLFCLRRRLRKVSKKISAHVQEEEEMEDVGSIQRVIDRSATFDAANRAKADVQVYSQNLGGDTIVEYVGTNVSMLLVVYFGNRGVFSFDCPEMSKSTILAALLAQHAPEVIVDICSVYVELLTGLTLIDYLRDQFRWRVLASKCAFVWLATMWVLTAKSVNWQ